MSAGFEKGGRVATCVEIAVERPGGAVKPVRVVEAFECGAVVNPEHLRNQIEGAVIMGLGGALFEHIDFTDGKILNNRLSRYRVPRFADVPAIEVVLLDVHNLAPREAIAEHGGELRGCLGGRTLFACDVGALPGL